MLADCSRTDDGIVGMMVGVVVTVGITLRMVAGGVADMGVARVGVAGMREGEGLWSS